MNVLPFCHPRRLTQREIAQNVEHILDALRRMSRSEGEK